MYFMFDSASTPAGGSQTYEVLFGDTPGETEYEDFGVLILDTV